ncbi:MAG TPA: ABC transporter permease [Candidatus Limnocylindrales bacterium]|nr:ABC transporter permease [Candidatus Limnocylindrales bacterium]
MLQEILHRLLTTIPTLLGISFLVFLTLRATPGDPARIMLGERASEQALAELRRELGLDKPWYIQYGRFLKGVLQGDLGRSIKTREKIVVEIKNRFPATMELAIASMIFATTLGTLAGIVSSTRRYSFLDYGTMIGALMGASMPIFWLGLLLILVFSVNLGWFPVSGRLNPQLSLQTITNFYIVDSLLTGNWAALKDTLWHLILPAVALGTIPLSLIARMTRSSMLEVLQQEFIRTAYAKGLSERWVIYKHALRNALIPIITVTGLQLGFLLGGAILTETIFAWPGVGRWLVLAVQARDFPAVQGGAMLLATTFVLLNLLVDLLYAYVDPRIKG